MTYYLVKMIENTPIKYSGEFALVRESLNDGKISTAINHFRNISLSVPLPELYTFYCYLKNEIILSDTEEKKKLGIINDLFLRILEEKGETEDGIYRSLLRDSSEYMYLNTLFSGKIQTEFPDEPVTVEKPVEVEEKPEIITMKKILSSKCKDLLEYDIQTWYDIVHEYFYNTSDETAFVKKSARVINYVTTLENRELFHLELIIVYTIDRLLEYKALTTKSKDFAMQAMNLMTETEPLWSRLHNKFLEIIKK